MNADTRTMDIAATDAAAGNRFGSYAFSYLLGAFLLGSLIWLGGTWLFLGNTRILDTLIQGGVVAFTDSQAGFIKGVPDLKLYLKSQDPIKWGLVDLAALIFLVFWLLKAVQFHIVAKAYNIRGTFTQHSRVFLHGIGINRLLPFNQGNVQIAKGLLDQDADPARASFMVFLMELFVVFEIVVFAVIGLLAVGWTLWLGQMFWALVILGVCYLFARSTRRNQTPLLVPGSMAEVRGAVRSLFQRPWACASALALSMLAFGLEDVAAYLIAMAFTSTYVILNVDFSILLMAVVASYIARLIPLTPGGIGQFEWGFATALYIGGVGLPECVAIAVLDNALRYISGTLLLAWVYILRIDYAFDFFRDVMARGQTKAPTT